MEGGAELFGGGSKGGGFGCSNIIKVVGSRGGQVLLCLLAVMCWILAVVVVDCYGVVVDGSLSWCG